MKAVTEERNRAAAMFSSSNAQASLEAEANKAAVTGMSLRGADMGDDSDSNAQVQAAIAAAQEASRKAMEEMRKAQESALAAQSTPPQAFPAPSAPTSTETEGMSDHEKIMLQVQEQIRKAQEEAAAAVAKAMKEAEENMKKYMQAAQNQG